MALLATGCGGATPPPRASAGLAGAPLVLITVDTLRADRLGTYGSTRGLTPVLDRLAREGVRFDAAVAQVPLTLPSHATILTGLHPARHGVRTNDGFRLTGTHETLATWLRAAGYATGAFIGAFPLDRRFGLDRDFHVYDDGFLRQPAEAGGAPPNERRAGAVIAAALAWIERQDRPWFAWVHLFDPHTPYEPPDPFAARFAAEPYDGEVAYTDHAIGLLLDRLRSLGWFDRCVIVVVADHGEGLGDHGERTHGVFLYDATIRVPLLLRVPGAPTGRVIDSPVETTDLVPTLLQWLAPGAAVGRSFDGQSLVPLIDGAGGDPDRPAYAESYHQYVLLGWSPLRAVRTQRWKYIEAPRPELYDLREDPAERHNRAAERSSLVRGLATALPPPMRPGWQAAPHTTVPPDAGERLRSLGYFAGRTVAAPGKLKDPKDGLPIWRCLEDAIELMDRDPVRAEVRLHEALRLDPQNGMAWKYLGDTLARQQRVAAAVDAYRKAIAKGFEHPDAFLNLGTYARRLGRAVEARAALERGLALDPAAPDAWNELGILRAEAGDRAGARTAFERLVSMAPDRAEPYYNLALLDLADGDAAAARSRLEAVLARVPRHADARIALANLDLLSGRAAEALAGYEMVLAGNPRHLDALLGAARAARELGHTRAAIEFYQRFAATAPPDRRAQADAARREARRLAAGR